VIFFNKKHFNFLSIIFFCSTVSGQALAAITLDRVLVVIGDKALLQSDLDEALAKIKATPSLAGAYRLEASQVTPNALLEKLIEDKIIQQIVAEKSLGVSDSEVEKQISSIAQQNRIDKIELRRSLEREGISFEMYKNNIRAQLERRNLFDRELRSGSGVSEIEVRALYEKLAEVELDMHLISVKNTPANQSSLEKLVSDLKNSRITTESALGDYSAQDLGWLKVDDLNPNLKKSLGELRGQGAAGPTLQAGNLQIIIVTGARRGSEEEFVRVKDSLMMRAQTEDFERRFAIWLERKKDELQILINQ